MYGASHHVHGQRPQSPSELQDLLDVVRQLLEELERPRAKPAEASLPEDPAATAADDTLQDEEFREKFRIVKVGREGAL